MKKKANSASSNTPANSPKSGKKSASGSDKSGKKRSSPEADAEPVAEDVNMNEGEEEVEEAVEEEAAEKEVGVEEKIEEAVEEKIEDVEKVAEEAVEEKIEKGEEAVEEKIEKVEEAVEEKIEKVIENVVEEVEEKVEDAAAEKTVEAVENTVAEAVENTGAEAVENTGAEAEENTVETENAVENTVPEAVAPVEEAEEKVEEETNTKETVEETPVVDKAEDAMNTEEPVNTKEAEPAVETKAGETVMKREFPDDSGTSEAQPNKSRKLDGEGEVEVDSGTTIVVLSEDDDDKDDDADSKSTKSVASDRSQSPSHKREEYQDCDDTHESTLNFELCTDDSTPQCFFGPHNRSMRALCCEGFQYLLCASRANRGFNAGSYCFEIQWIEKARSTGFVSVGLSVRPPNGKRGMLPAKSDCVLFSSTGHLFGDSTKELFTPFDRSQRISVAFDCTCVGDASISLYCDGKRVSPMMDFTESMKEALRNGEGVFPTLVARSSSVLCNFGPQLLAPLPFKARMISEADVEHTIPNPRNEESPEVIFVMQFPTQECSYTVPDGYLEVSDKSLCQWAIESENAYNGGSFAIKSLDDREPLFNHYLHLCSGLRRKLCIISSDLLRETKRREIRSMFGAFKQKAIVRLQPVIDSPGRHYQNYSVPTDSCFEEVVFETPREEADRILTSYIAHHKLNEKLEPTIPSTFQTQLESRNDQVNAWKKILKGLTLPEPDDEYRDVMSADIDTGGQDGLPLFAFFTEEDWALFDLRSNFVSMFASFTSITSRDGFHVKHLEHYYLHFFKKPWKPSVFGCNTIEEVLEIVPDCKLVDDLLQLNAAIDPSPSNMIRLTELERRERRFRVDAGDETAKLKFSVRKDKEKDRRSRERERERERERDRSRSRRNRRR